MENLKICQNSLHFIIQRKQAKKKKKENFWSLKINVESQQDGLLGIGTSNQTYNQSSFPGTRRMKGEN